MARGLLAARGREAELLSYEGLPGWHGSAQLKTGILEKSSLAFVSYFSHAHRTPCYLQAVGGGGKGHSILSLCTFTPHDSSGNRYYNPSFGAEKVKQISGR